MEIIENATIDSTMIGLTYYLHLSGDGWGQGFGGYALDKHNKKTKKREGVAYGMESIRRILEAVGVSKWEDLRGEHIRIRRTDQGMGATIMGIGHITKNQWFFPEDLVEIYYPKEEK